MLRMFLFSSCLSLAFSSATYAAPKPKSPFALAQAEARLLTSETNFLSAGKRLSKKDMLSLDTKLIETYGEPTKTRGGLKVWEVPNDKKGRGHASHITIMCGVDADGSQIFVIDGRGQSQGDNPRLKKRKSNLKPSKQSSALSNTQSNRPAVKQNDWD